MTWRVRWDELPLGRSTVDRAAGRRGEPGLVDELLARPTTRVLLAHRGRFASIDDALAAASTPTSSRPLAPAPPAPPATPGSPTSPALADLRPPDDAAVRGVLAVPQRYFLGLLDDVAYVALVIPDDAEPPPGLGWANLRELGERLSARDAGLVATTLALAAWHDSHRFCPRCGAATEVSFAGWQRECVAEGNQLYPRTDPAVIMAVTDEDDRLLLGRATHWPERRFSTLAGFVEAGESAEQALRREVLEEVSLPVAEISYRGSQSWPFPASLMLAYRARATATSIVVDGVELAEARWFDRPGLRAAASSGEVLLPGRASVARALIEEWHGAALP